MQVYTKKQAEVILNANARWNILNGATRSGKTRVTYDLVPIRVATQPQAGGRLMVGKTLSTLDENVLEPMREKYGTGLVSEIKRSASGTHYVNAFGRRFRTLGANDKKSESKIRGSGLIYCLGDEISTWNESFFDMLKSRLDSKDAIFDGTTNPDHPNHWLKKFIDNPNIQHLIKLFNFTIDDNEFLDPEFVEALKAEYTGTVYYGRYIQGQWVAAEGTCYPKFADNPKEYIVDFLEPGQIRFISIGVDFGENASAHAFNATGFKGDFTEIYTIEDYRNDKPLDANEVASEFVNFVKMVSNNWGAKIIEIRADSAAQVMIRTLQAALIKSGTYIPIKNAIKTEINDRIEFYNMMIGKGAYKILKHCTNTINAFKEALWKEQKSSTKDERLDDGTTNIDNLDAQEYSTEPWYKQVEAVLLYRR